MTYVVHGFIDYEEYKIYLVTENIDAAVSKVVELAVPNQVDHTKVDVWEKEKYLYSYSTLSNNADIIRHEIRSGLLVTKGCGQE
jgi:hypothetical protein